MNNDMDPTPCYCPFHQRDCIVPHWQTVYWPDYADDDCCIADDDLTTTMLNRAVETNHPFIDDLKELARQAESGRCFQPGLELSPDDLERWLDGDDSLTPADCSTIGSQGLDREQTRRSFKRMVTR